MFKFDGSWLKILEQSTWVLGAICIFSLISYVLLVRGIFQSLLGYPWLPDASLIVFVFFACLSISSIMKEISNKISQYFKKRKIHSHQISRLDSLSPIEHRILSYAIQTGRQSFKTRLDNGDVSLLVQKGLLIRGGGTQNILEMPHFIPDHVWNELQMRISDFDSADLTDNPPWQRHWMSY